MPVDSPPALPVCGGKWLYCAVVSVFAVVATCWPDGLANLAYERSALADGELWRDLSGHLVHLNAVHLLLNLLGLFLICELLWHDLPLRHASAVLVLAASGISVLLWWRHPELLRYAGLSGVLHALWAVCAVRSWRTWAGLAGSVLLLAKLGAEWRYGAASGVAQMIGAPVVTAAHLYGALLGAVYLLSWRAGLAWRGRK